MSNYGTDMSPAVQAAPVSAEHLLTAQGLLTDLAGRRAAPRACGHRARMAATRLAYAQALGEPLFQLAA